MSGRRLLTGAERHRNRPAASSSSAQHVAELPEYEPPDCPLDETSRRALASLVSPAESRKYKGYLNESFELLRDSVRDINDRYVERRGMLKNMQEKRRERDPDSEPSEHERQMMEAIEILRDAVPELTDSSEASVREIIDWQVELEDEAKAMEETVAQLEAEFAQISEEIQQNPDDELPQPTGACAIFDKSRDSLKAEYESTTMFQRYGQNNDYIHFKKLWHDAVHAEDGKPLPEANKWFGRDGRVEREEDDDDDDELIIAGEVQDFRCPLSMQVMREPYTAPACKHTFEMAAIYEYLGSQPGRKVRCPQTGCTKEFTKKDLYYDDVVVRRIKRAKQKAEREALQDEEMEELDDEGDDDDGESMQVTAQRRVKKENRDRRDNREGRDRGDALVDSIMQGQ